MSLEFITRLIRVEPKVWTTTTATVQQQMSARLRNETEIRVFVDDTLNFGNQSCSVLLLNRLIDTYGFTGAGKTLTVVYAAEHAGDTLGKLALLIQGLNPASPDIPNYRNTGVHLAFREIPQLAEMAQVNYGFAGGADSGGVRDGPNWFAVALKVRLFLRLQPYQWFGGPHEVQYGAPHLQTPPYDLTNYRALGTSFRYRNWYVPPADWAAPNDAEWAYYTTEASIAEDQRRRASLARALLAYLAAHPSTLKLMVAYGIKAPNQMRMQPAQLLPTVVATALGACELDPARTPVVVVSLNDDITDDQYNLSLRVSRGGRTADEQLLHDTVLEAQEAVDTLEQQLQGGADANIQQQLEAARLRLAQEAAGAQLLDSGRIERLNWLNRRNAQGIRFISSRPRAGGPAVDPDQLDQALGTLADPSAARPAVLFFELGSLPVPVFNHLMSEATYTNVFEGANSNNLALNQGNGYLRMRGTDPHGVRYPTGWFPAWLGSYTAAAVQSVAAADGVTAALYQNVFQKTDFLPNIALTTGYLERLYLRPAPLLTRYYENTRAYFHNPANDKLLLGLSYLNQIATDIGL